MPYKDRMKPEKLALARKMAKNPTPSEAALWERLKGNKLGVGFLCQERVLGFIADFYCPVAKLVIEIDGPIHERPDVAQRDKVKNRALRWKGLTVLRLGTEMTVDQMVERIDLKLHYLQVPRHQPAPPAQQEAGPEAA